MMRLILPIRFFLLPFALAFVVDFKAAWLAQTNELPPRPGTVGVQKLSPNRISTSRRVALVIGNAKYQVGPLRNPANDARAMARVLHNLGFEVILVTDSTLRQMDEALEKFYEKIQQGSIGIFYYAGHGIQSEGENYLIPVNAKLRVEQDLRYSALPVGRVLGLMEAARNDVNIVILDACRDNPLARSWRSTQRGLAPINTATGVYIAYATAPGKVAADGDGQNGTFTAALLRHIKKPHEDIEQLFKQVREDVSKKTIGKQVPWTASSLIGNFSFYNNPNRSTQSLPNLPGNSYIPMDAESESIPCPGSVCEGLP